MPASSEVAVEVRDAASAEVAVEAAMPVNAEVSVVLPAHLHARPAGALVRAAAGFTSAIEVRFGDKTANARGVLALLGLGATAGTTVIVRAVGDDADEAARAVAAVLEAAE